jgi:hypothetical protein
LLLLRQELFLLRLQGLKLLLETRRQGRGLGGYCQVLGIAGAAEYSGGRMSAGITALRVGAVRQRNIRSKTGTYSRLRSSSAIGSVTGAGGWAVELVPGAVASCPVAESGGRPV